MILVPTSSANFPHQKFRASPRISKWNERPRAQESGRQEVIGFGGRPQEVIGFGDLWGPSGNHHSKKLSIFDIFVQQHMSFLAKNALSKFILSFVTMISNETEPQ